MASAQGAHGQSHPPQDAQVLKALPCQRVPVKAAPGQTALAQEGRELGLQVQESISIYAQSLPQEGFWEKQRGAYVPTCSRPCTQASGLRREAPRCQLTVPWKERAEGEGPGLAGVQVGQREAQHAQRVARLAALQKRQDAVCGDRARGGSEEVAGPPSPGPSPSSSAWIQLVPQSDTS